MSENLKPCPFCGSKDIVTRLGYNDAYKNPIIVKIYCFNCGSQMRKYVSQYATSFQDAVDIMDEIKNQWNRRVEDV